MIYILKRDNEETLISGLMIVMVMLIISITLSYITLNKIDKLAVPETTISSVVESTAAPSTIETIMPETEETIHIEETELPTIVPTTTPTKAPTTVPTTSRATVPPTAPPTKPTSAATTTATSATTSTVDPEELEMLACVIYQEAGGDHQCDDCRRYVADVVLNRIVNDDFPDTMYEVLTAKDQYGSFYYTGVKWPPRAEYEVEKDAVERAYRIAKEVLSGKHSKLYGNGYVWQAQFVQGTEGFWCCGHYYGK